jgi:periplasmic divalent cation tolerance protein
LTDVRVLLMTVPTAETAEDIVSTLVAERLIACGNITTPVSSIYRWADTTERAAEVLVIMKTTDAMLATLTQRIASLHPYDVPEILALPVVHGHDPYLTWVRDSVATSRDSNE